MRSRPKGSRMRCQDHYMPWRTWKYSPWPPRYWDGANIKACLHAPLLVHQTAGGKYSNAKTYNCTTQHVMHYVCVHVGCAWPLWPIGSLSGPSHLMGPPSGVPHLHGSGWGVSGVSGVSGFGGRVCVRGVRLFICGGGEFGLFLARPGLFPAPLGLLEGGEEEGAGHLVEGGAGQVFHPNGTVLRPWTPRTVPFSTPVG